MNEYEIKSHDVPVKTQVPGGPGGPGCPSCPSLPSRPSLPSLPAAPVEPDDKRKKKKERTDEELERIGQREGSRTLRTGLSVGAVSTVGARWAVVSASTCAYRVRFSATKQQSLTS